jgi:hypothetical protein
MQSWKIIAVAVTAVILGTVITATALAYYNGQTYYGTPYGNPNPYANYGSQPWGMGMMGGGRGMMGGGYQPYSNYPASSGYTPQNTYPQQTGWGCHGQWRNPQPYFNGTLTTPITINQAATISQQYLQSLNNVDLAVAEVEEYSLNFYVQYYEKSTSIGAFEMLVDKYSGRIYPEMGPNMMWNTKYGMMSGMMGRFWGTPTGPMTVTSTQAEANAQQFLDAYYLGTTVGEVAPFYGYYHVMVESAGTTYGMLSVNGYTGQVWYHTWHGNFIQELEL